MSLERKSLGLGCKVLMAALVLLTVALVGGGAVAVRARFVEGQKREELTKRRLSSLAVRLRCHTEPLPRASGGESRQDILRKVSYTILTGNPAESLQAFDSGAAALDGWNHPIYYRCPGPIHKNGFDLISCGPNGVYEEGGGDDIVVGEDLPGGIAAIESGR